MLARRQATTPTVRTGALARLGRGAARHPRAVVLAWLAVLVLAVVLAARIGGSPRDNFAIPGTSAQEGIDLIERAAPALTDVGATVVFAAPTGQQITNPANQAVVTAALAKVRQLPGVVPGGVSDPFADPAATLGWSSAPGATVPGTDLPVGKVVPRTVSPDQRLAYATVSYGGSPSQVPADAFDVLQGAVAPPPGAGLTVAVGGELADLQDPIQSPLSEHADEIGLACAVIILLVSLGTVAGMAVPIVLALFSLTVAAALTELLEGVIEIGSVGPALGTMMGLGVGIDYALFVVSRYRQNLGQGLGPVDAVSGAVSTAGSAVLFAGVTVCFALCGLYLIGVPYIGTVGFTAAVYVAVTVVAALTLLPALLGWLGHRIDALRLPWHRPVDHETPERLARSLSARWAHTVAGRPWLFAGVSLALLLALTVPLTHLHLGMTDDSQDPLGSPQRQAYDLLTEGFGAGHNGQLYVVAHLPGAGSAAGAGGGGPASPSSVPSALPAADPSAAGAPPAADPSAAAPSSALAVGLRLVGALVAEPAVQTATPVPLADPEVAVVAVTPVSGPSDDRTADLVRDLRQRIVPTAVAGTAVAADQVDVTGTTAVMIDFAERVRERMAPFIGAVLAATFLLLMMVFRSVFVPVKAVAMNLLSIGASFGVLVLVFQDGFLRGPLGIESAVPIVVFVPMVMFAVLFGLSMDYEVFLLTRVREDYVRTGDSRASVETGLANTARVITSAALIMIMVFLAGATNPMVAVKMLGLGMAVAVLVDATVVRMILVPSTMELMGRANWWLPRWLDRILPRINVD